MSSLVFHSVPPLPMMFGCGLLPKIHRFSREKPLALAMGR